MMSELKGYLCLVLHTHLPFVRHPEEKYFLEENWLYEAITETYLPLLEVFNNLSKDNIKFKVTISLTPTLISMLRDPLLQSRYISHINRLIELSEKEIQRTKYQPHFQTLALRYNDLFRELKKNYIYNYKKDIVSAFKKLQDKGCLEIMASCATHGFLPILNVNKTSAISQIKIGIAHYKKIFGKYPKGFWLPECAYAEGLDSILSECGIRYFFLDAHGVANANPSPKYGLYAPIYTPSGIAAFARDHESSKQVWSAREGYPGDPNYREYYRDIGHELDFDYIKPYIHPDGIRINTGIKYRRITGHTEYKEVYRPDLADQRADEHAKNFLLNKRNQIEHLHKQMDRKPILIAPYDAELFGHWWYEGPQWINYLIRKIALDQKTIELITPSQYLKKYPVNQMARPCASTWGYQGYNEFWLDGVNDWIYPHLHKAGERMRKLANKFSADIHTSRKTIIKRALHQAARELLLAESSDWPFIMKAGTMVPYAHRRFKNHIGRFTKLYQDIKNNTLDKNWLKKIEERDNIFKDLECANYYLNENKHKNKEIKKNKRKEMLCQT